MRTGRLIIAALLLGAVAFPAAAASTVPTPGRGLFSVPVKSLAALKFKNVVRQSRDLSCGAAALSTLLNYYYGEEVSEAQVIDAMLELGDQEKIAKDGFSMLELKRFSERLGYVSAGFRIEDVNNLTKLQVPAIALVNTRGYAHFVVVKGVDQGRVFIADPAFGNRSLSIAAFDKEWSNVILVVLSETRDGSSAFILNGMAKAPSREVMLLLDRGLRTITPGPGEF